MLLVLASRHDERAVQLVERWQQHNARLLTCEGLSASGWTWAPDQPSAASLVVDGYRVPTTRLAGAVSLLSGVDPGELPQIVDEDRAYVAAEMMAFLVAWLSSLPCPVLNRPTPLCLTGPRLHHEQWLQAAAQAGLPILPSTRSVPSFSAGSTSTSTSAEAGIDGIDGTPPLTTYALVGGKLVPSGGKGQVDASTELGLRALAAATGAGLLTASFLERNGKCRFACACPTVDVSQPSVADAMLAELVGMS